ncbi:haloacid dehalogenase type II [Alteromonas ponticola]|uniref:(S)-2-haloacid dehalogenase n=1 Tax=Alteromonas ponticola TaxID=2720613 RepID=A0ABX1QY13_9ALTE|nr:haloacid dehalogenase type II [Alteromonas ponticola]NMH59133.1 haloacid dehalogenase type II [Alteromonas ponticola]
MKPAALIFDVNETLLDLSSAKPALASLFNGQESLVELWFSMLLHHSLVESSIGGKHNFSEIGAATAQMVAYGKGISLSFEHALHVIKDAMTTLPAYDDAAKALKTLSQSGIKLIALSNSPTKGLRTQLEYAGIINYFNDVLSVEDAGRYKPHADVYHWACDKIGVAVENCMMVAAHGWDVAGAANAGMRTVFVEREGKCQYPLSAEASFSVSSLDELADIVLNQ